LRSFFYVGGYLLPLLLFFFLFIGIFESDSRKILFYFTFVFNRVLKGCQKWPFDFRRLNLTIHELD